MSTNNICIESLNTSVIDQLTGRKQFDSIPAELSANDFNEYFSSIGSETVAHLSSSDNETASKRHVILAWF